MHPTVDHNSFGRLGETGFRALALRAPRSTPVWIDAVEIAQAVLSGGAVPAFVTAQGADLFGLSATVFGVSSRAGCDGPAARHSRRFICTSHCRSRLLPPSHDAA